MFFFSIFLMTSSGIFLNWRSGLIDCHLQNQAFCFSLLIVKLWEPIVFETNGQNIVYLQDNHQAVVRTHLGKLINEYSTSIIWSDLVLMCDHLPSITETMGRNQSNIVSLWEWPAYLHALVNHFAEGQRLVC